MDLCLQLRVEGGQRHLYGGGRARFLSTLERLLSQGPPLPCRKQPSCLHSTSPHGHSAWRALRKPAKSNRRSEEGTLPSTSFQAVRTRALTQGPARHVARKPSALAVAPILAGDTPAGKHHQPLNAHHQQRTSQGWALPRRARGQLSHQGYVRGARPAPEPPQLGGVHVVPDSAEALAQAEGGQADLELTACHGVCPALSPPGLPAPASRACG